MEISVHGTSPGAGKQSLWKHIQDYYAYEMNVRKVSANTVKHRHANIHKALSYAYKTDLIQTNPADKVELPTIDKFVGHFYNAAQLEEMFKIFKGDPAEFGVIAASFYGLRRSEVGKPFVVLCNFMPVFC